MPHCPEDEGRDDATVQQVTAGHDNEEETKKLNHRGGPAFTEAPAIVRETPPAHPLRFYARLRYQLETRGINYDGLPRLTAEGESPPCFKKLRVSFGAWLGSASMLGATVPYRYDMPAEPNYCWDCTPQFRDYAKKRGACNFPDVRFERFRTLAPDSDGRRVPEVEVLGVTRPPRVDTDLFAAYDAQNSPEE